MGIHWQVRCPGCGTDGPDLRYSVGQVNFNGEDEEWVAFLLKHEWDGPLILEHEGASRSFPELLHHLLASANMEPEPPPPARPLKPANGWLSLGELWAALGHEHMEVEKFPDLQSLAEAIVSEIRAKSHA